MSYADTLFLQTCREILEQGTWDTDREVRPRWEDGTPAHTIKRFGVVHRYDLRKEFPILTVRRQYLKSAVDELLWIWQKKSNRIQDLNSHIWDSWADENGTIGKAYGYQIRKYKQVDKLLDMLRNDPQNRRMIVSLWNIEDLPDMALQPCAFQTLWDVTDGRLNCMLIQRSGDMGLGVPFNMTQYAVLIHLIAQSVGLQPGLFTHVINNAHIYENHVEALKTQLARRGKAMDAPKLVIAKDITDFYAFTPDDIALDNYRHLGKLPMEVAV